MTGPGSAANGRFCRVAVLAVGLVIGAGSQADAARYYWGDGEPYFYRPAPRPFPRQYKPRHGQAQKTQTPQKDAAKPQGPLIIAISINQQRLKVYDARGVFAESPVSTGMLGHPTPMGVFSVIQKHKFHRSNIYSNAPMPYMQRITWSGVAMHAGVLPGYPASHGCIRMPMAFAIKMWNWTRMGARVVVTPGELTPATFAHALLPTQKVVPQPVAAVEPDSDTPIKSEAASAEAANVKAASAATANVATDLALRTSHSHEDSVTAGTTTLRAQTRTADAGGDAKALRITMSDASSGSGIAQHEDGAAKSDSASESMPPASADGAKRAATVQPSALEGKPAAAAPSDTVAVVRPAEISAKTQEGKSQDIKTQDAKAQDTATAKVVAKPDDKSADAKIETKPETRIDAAKPDAARIDPAAESAGEAAKDGVKDTGKDASRPFGVKTDPPRRPGQIAVFISRKDSKLYVRQNFAPLFEVPVTIAPSDRPLGTHVFTADVDKDNNALHWSVVTLPVSMRGAARAADAERGVRLRKSSLAVEAKPPVLPDTPTEALDRIGLPADAMTRVSDALTSGSSIIVSDQGINQGETGEGTDFIVSLR